MLTTPRAIVLAGVLALLGLVGQALLPRYDVRIIDNGAGFARVDRWTGSLDVTGVHAGSRLAAWVTVGNRPQ